MPLHRDAAAPLRDDFRHACAWRGQPSFDDGGAIRGAGHIWRGGMLFHGDIRAWREQRTFADGDKSRIIRLRSACLIDAHASVPERSSMRNS